MVDLLRFIISIPIKLISMFNNIVIFGVPIYIAVLSIVLCIVIIKKLFGGK